MRLGWFAQWVEAEQGRFFPLLPIAMGAAILVYFQLPFEPPWWWGLVLIALSAGLLAIGWRHAYLRFFALLAFSGALGFARAEWRTAALPPMVAIPAGVSAVSGFVLKIEPLPKGTRILLRAPRLDYGPTLHRYIRIKLKQGDTPPPPGTLVKCHALLFAPQAPAYPGGWEQRRNDYFANIAAAGVAVTDLTVLRPAPRDDLRNILQAVRTKIANTILATLPLSTGSIAVTLLTGDEQIIPAAERRDFVLAGLAHILAVAGLHVGIVMGLFFALTRWLLSRSTWIALHWPCKPLAAIMALLAGCLYAFLTGGHLPILRSLAMASLVTLGVVVGRRSISLRGLAIAAIMLMLIMPEVVLSAGFQMSFSAVAALIAGYAAVHTAWSRPHPGRHGARKIAVILAEVALTSLLAGGASMPFAAYQFQQVTPYWIPANLVAVPLTALWIMPLGLAGVALMPLHLSWLAFHPMGWGISVIVWIAHEIATWPRAQMIVLPVPATAILLYAAGLAWLCIWRSRARLLGIGLMLLAWEIAIKTPPPKVLMTADASLIAIHHDHAVFIIAQPKASKFTLRQWRHVWGHKPLIPAQCAADLCRLGRILYANVPTKDCHGAAILVSPVAQPGCVGTRVLDAAFAARNGALAAWISRNHHVRVVTDRALEGTRPWSAP